MVDKEDELLRKASLATSAGCGTILMWLILLPLAVIALIVLIMILAKCAPPGTL
jgi:hypothetical protein